MASGFLYLVAIIDWGQPARCWPGGLSKHDGQARSASRRLEEALQRYSKPRMFNTDQGAQFTSAAFTGKLEAAGGESRSSMDGAAGRFMDNIFIERLWRSIKYEEVHLKAYADGPRGRGPASADG